MLPVIDSMSEVSVAATVMAPCARTPATVLRPLTTAWVVLEISFFENAPDAAMLPVLAPMAAETAKISLSLVAVRPSAPDRSRSESTTLARISLVILLSATDRPTPALPPKLTAPAMVWIVAVSIAVTSVFVPARTLAPCRYASVLLSIVLYETEPATPSLPAPPAAAVSDRMVPPLSARASSSPRNVRVEPSM